MPVKISERECGRKEGGGKEEGGKEGEGRREEGERREGGRRREGELISTPKPDILLCPAYGLRTVLTKELQQVWQTSKI